jgi:hypothetical protein
MNKLKPLGLLLSLFLPLSMIAQYPTLFETSNGTQTPTYAEGIAWYQRIAADFKEIDIQTKGLTDSGFPLHLVLYSKNRKFDLAKLKAQGKAIFFINNAIHPGEPDGVDASMLLLRDMALHPERFPMLDSVVVALIPFYNIGGTLNRSSTSRVSQNGPEEHGFRGNARNYDLNRDFIKADTRNALSFEAIFQALDPDVFIDTHVSNGADYQYTMTFCYAQEEKLGGVLGKFHKETFLPYLYDHMKKTGFEATPYVNAFGQTPDKGFSQFPDWPRYSTGYAALFHTMGMMTETHMLKPYPQRVKATYALLEGVLQFLGKHRARLLAVRQATKEAVKTQTEFPLTWKLNREKFSEVEFKGYEPEYPLSQVSDQKRLYYNRDKPLNKIVPFYDHYDVDLKATKPSAYIIPQGWHNVIERLKVSGVQMRQLQQDSTLELEVYIIDAFQSAKNPYEGHHQNTSVDLHTERHQINLRKGDFFIPLNQWRNRFIVEVLEPQGVDSYFRWNFFDTVLQEKGGYSSYVFEDLAAELLQKDPALKRKLEEKKQGDKAFAENAGAQLDFVYRNSIYWEKEYMRYPVYRVLASTK